MGVTFRRVPELSGPLEILRDQDFPFVVDIYLDDQPASLTNATVQIRKPGGTDVVSAVSVTPSAGPEASSNRLAYTFLTAANDTLGESYTVTWKVTVDGIVREHRFVFDVVRTQLINVVTEDDLFQRVPVLRDMRSLSVIQGTADSGTGTTLVDDQLKQYPDDFYNGGTLTALDGTNEGETRNVSDFVRSTGTVTVGESFPSAIDNTTVYELRRSWEPLIQEAFDDVAWAVRRAGFRPALIIDAGELRTPTLFLAAALAFESNPKGGTEGDNWLLAQQYRKRWREWFGATKFRYDLSEDGTVDSEASFARVRARRR